MKKFKKIDYVVQIILIAGAVLYALIYRDNIFPSYFVVGGWQVFSALIHLVFGFPRVKGRKIYNIWLLTATALTATGLLDWKLLIYFLFFLLFVSPVIAVLYTYLCYLETYRPEKLSMYKYNYQEVSNEIAG